MKSNNNKTIETETEQNEKNYQKIKETTTTTEERIKHVWKEV